MENNGTITITVDEYRDLLTSAANYAMLRDVIKAGVSKRYDGGVGINPATESVVARYVLGEDYAPTVEALKARED